MRVDPLQRLDVGVHQLLDDVFVAVDVIVFHQDADEGVGPAESRLGRLRCAQVYQDFSNTTRYQPSDRWFGGHTCIDSALLHRRDKRVASTHWYEMHLVWCNPNIVEDCGGQGLCS